MTFATTTLAALSVAAVTAIAIIAEPAAVSTSADVTSATAKSEYLILAGGRGRRKCTEDLGYGRTGSFGCGG